MHEARAGTYVDRVAATPELVADLAIWLRDRGVRIGELQTGRRSLEEVFLRSTARGARDGTPPARRSLGQARIELLLTIRRGESLLVSLVIPIGILLFFSKVDAVNTIKDPVDFLVPGVLALAVMSTAMVSLGIATGLRTPLRRAEAARFDAVVALRVCSPRRR